MGWLTAAEPFTEKFTYQIHGTALGPCSFTQVCLQGWQATSVPLLLGVSMQAFAIVGLCCYQVVLPLTHEVTAGLCTDTVWLTGVHVTAVGHGCSDDAALGQCRP